MGNCVSLQISCDKALNNACSCLFGDGNCMHMMEANLEALHKAMQELKERRDDLLTRVVAEEDEGLQRLAQVQGWLSRVEGVESQVNHLLEARSTQTKRLCLCGYCSLNFISGCNYGRKVLKKLNEVEELLSNVVFEAVTEKIPARKVEKKHIPVTVGLNRRVKKAWKHLFKDGRTKALGLYGKGGIGKTTLLAAINNKFLEEIHDFDVVIWVVVSKELRYEGSQYQILRSLNPDKKWEHETEEERANEIYNILNGKKFVLLLDDLWSKVDLAKVGVPPATLQNCSKIVFTTRSCRVCKDMEADDVMEVVRLSPDESLELFKKQLGYLTLRFHPDMALAGIVVDLCNGLPLALIVTGRSMTRKTAVQEWRLAISALVSSVREFHPCTEERVLPVLRFSYDRLEEERAKLCFLYCSLFPADYKIEKNKLIEYWECEGLIDGSRDEGGDNKQGHHIIDLLVSAHLLIGGPLRVKMHDVVREMALWIAAKFGERKEQTFCVKAGVWLHQIPKEISSVVVRRVSLMSNQIAEISCSPNCPKLSTLLLGSNKLVDIPGEFFRFMPTLVVLDLSENQRLVGLPEEISRLGSLQYLNLSSTGIKSLPVGMKKLRKLVVLNLDFTLELRSIVGVVTSLPDLQVLKFYYSGVFLDERLMGELQLLKHLKHLKATVEDAVVLESLQRVVPLANSIRSLCLRNMTTPVAILNAVALGGLERLSIMDCKISEIKIGWESKEGRGVLPRTSSQSFKHLFTIMISGLDGPRDLTWVAYAQNLRFLYVMRSPSVEEIINAEKGMRISNEHPRIGAPFTKLKHLEISGMDELKIICQNPRALPNLRDFTVRACPKLPLSLRDMRNK